MDTLTSEQRDANAAAYERRQALEYTARISECNECQRTMQVMIWGGNVVLRCPVDFQHEGYRQRRSLTQLAKEGIYIPYVSERVERQRRDEMVAQIGETETRDLAIYGTERIVMTQPAAQRIIAHLWPKASPVAVERAIMIAVQSNLNPLMKEVYIIPYGDREEVVLGIDANRKIARRRTPFQYRDGPRAMTKSEMEDIGEDPKEKIGVVTILETPAGARFPGYGFWSRSAKVMGADKGNTGFNMASYRSERNALRRLMPDNELPAPVEMVIDGSLADITEIVEVTPPAKGIQAPRQAAPKPAEKLPDLADAEALIDLAEKAGLTKAELHEWVVSNARTAGIPLEGETIDIVLGFSEKLLESAREKLQKRIDAAQAA